MTKKEMDLLLGVLQKYVDTRICEIVEAPLSKKDPSETVALLWHKFETNYMRDFCGNSTPITHTVFREFLHWLDDAVDELEKILKAHIDDGIDRKFLEVKLASRLNVYKNSSDNYWYIELVDQNNNRMGDAFKLPFYVVKADKGSGIEVINDTESGAYNLKIKTNGSDTTTKRYVNTDNNGAYVKVDRINPVLTDGEIVATIERGSNGKEEDLFVPTPFIPDPKSMESNGKQRSLIGSYGEKKVYYDDENCTFEGHYEPSGINNDVNTKELIPIDGKRRVLTGLKVDIKGHMIAGTYAEVNADGTLGEDINIDFELPEEPTIPDEPEEPVIPAPVIYYRNVTIQIVDVDTQKVLLYETKTYSGQAGETINLSTQTQRVMQKLENLEQYSFVDEADRWYNNEKPTSITIDPNGKSDYSFTAKAKKAEPEAVPATVTIMAQLVAEDNFAKVLTTLSFTIEGFVGQTKPVDKSRLNIVDWFDDHGDDEGYEYQDVWINDKRIPESITIAKTETLVYSLIAKKKALRPKFTLIYKKWHEENHNYTEVARATDIDINDVNIGEEIDANYGELDQMVMDWVRNNGYKDNYTFEPERFVVQAVNEVVVFVEPNVSENPVFTLVFKLNGNIVESIVLNSMVDAEVGDEIDPSQERELDTQVVRWLASNNYDSINYAYESDRIRVTLDTKIVVNIATNEDYVPNTSISVNNPGGEVYENTVMPNDDDTVFVTLPVNPHSPDTNKVPTLPIYISVEHVREIIGNPDQGERENWTARVGMHADWTKFSEFRGTIEAEITMRDGSTYQLDMSTTDFNTNKTDKYVTMPQTVNVPLVTHVGVRYNFTFKLK